MILEVFSNLNDSMILSNLKFADNQRLEEQR